MSTDFSEIPVIDVAPLYAADETGARSVAEQIRRASVEVGFFYIRGHAVPLDLMRATLMAAKYFFSQPEPVKRAIQVNAAHRDVVWAEQRITRGADDDLDHTGQLGMRHHRGVVR